MMLKAGACPTGGGWLSAWVAPIAGLSDNLCRSPLPDILHRGLQWACNRAASMRFVARMITTLDMAGEFIGVEIDRPQIAGRVAFGLVVEMR